MRMRRKEEDCMERAQGGTTAQRCIKWAQMSSFQQLLSGVEEKWRGEEKRGAEGPICLKCTADALRRPWAPRHPSRLAGRGRQLIRGTDGRRQRGQAGRQAGRWGSCISFALFAWWAAAIAWPPLHCTALHRCILLDPVFLSSFFSLFFSAEGELPFILIRAPARARARRRRLKKRP